MENDIILDSADRLTEGDILSSTIVIREQVWDDKKNTFSFYYKSNGNQYQTAPKEIKCPVGVEITATEIVAVQNKINEALQDIIVANNTGSKAKRQLTTKIVVKKNNINSNSREESVTYETKGKIKGLISDLKMSKDLKESQLESMINAGKDLFNELRHAGNVSMNSMPLDDSMETHIQNVLISSVALALAYNEKHSENPIKEEDVIITSFLYKVGGNCKDMKPADLEALFDNYHFGNSSVFTIPSGLEKEYNPDYELLYSFMIICEKLKHEEGNGSKNETEREKMLSSLKNNRWNILFSQERADGKGLFKKKLKNNDVIPKIIKFCDFYYTKLAEIQKSGLINYDREIAKIMNNEIRNKIKSGDIDEELAKLFIRKIPIFPRGTKVVLTNDNKSIKLVGTVISPNEYEIDKPRVSIMIDDANGNQKHFEQDLSSERLAIPLKVVDFLTNTYKDDPLYKKDIKNSKKFLASKYKAIIDFTDSYLNFNNASEDYKNLIEERLVTSLLVLYSIDPVVVSSDINTLAKFVIDNESIKDIFPTINFDDMETEEINAELELIKENIKKCITLIPFSKFEEIANKNEEYKNNKTLLEEKKLYDKIKNQEINKISGTWSRLNKEIDFEVKKYLKDNVYSSLKAEEIIETLKNKINESKNIEEVEYLENLINQTKSIRPDFKQ